jgi:hypothetical protein
MTNGFHLPEKATWIELQCCRKNIAVRKAYMSKNPVLALFFRLDSMVGEGAQLAGSRQHGKKMPGHTRWCGKPK